MSNYKTLIVLNVFFAVSCILLLSYVLISSNTRHHHEPLDVLTLEDVNTHIDTALQDHIAKNSRVYDRGAQSKITVPPAAAIVPQLSESSRADPLVVAQNKDKAQSYKRQMAEINARSIELYDNSSINSDISTKQ